MRRVGPHVGDQASLPAGTFKVDAFVELLSDTHRPLELEAQPRRRLLLQGRGDKRWARARCGALRLDLRDLVIGGATDTAEVLDLVLLWPFGLFVVLLDRVVEVKAQGFGCLERRVALRWLKRLARHFNEFCTHALALAKPSVLLFYRTWILFFADVKEVVPILAELLCFGCVGGEHRAQPPVLIGHERFDLALTLNDQPRGNGLHPPRTQPASDFLPKQRRDLVANDTIEDAPRLLRIDTIDL